MKQQALATAGRIEDPLRRAHTHIWILDPVVDREVLGPALAAVNQAGDEVLGPLGRDLAVAIARAGDLDEAVGLAGDNPVQWDRDASFKEIAAVQAEAGQKEAALGTIEKIESEFYRAEALCGVAEALAGAEQVREGLALLEEIGPDYSCVAETYGRIAASITG